MKNGVDLLKKTAGKISSTFHTKKEKKRRDIGLNVKYSNLV